MSLEILISSLNNEDANKFIGYLKKKNKRKDAKNIVLFKLIYEGGLSSSELVKRLYASENKTGYHALRKRLNESLIDFIAVLSIEEEGNEETQIQKYLKVASVLLKQQEGKGALKLLSKAETLAKEYQLYTFLNKIYHTKIQFSHLLEAVNLNETIKQFNENQQLYLQEERLNIVYAKIREALLYEHYQGNDFDFRKLYETVLEEQQLTIQESLSFKSLYQIVTIASISAFVTKNYWQIETFILATFKLLEKRTIQRKEQYYYIQVLYMVANTMFRNKQFAISLEYLSRMKEAMLSENKKYNKRFELKYVLLQALNLNYSGRQELAIDLLTPFVQQKHKDIEGVLDIHLSLIVFQAQKNEFKIAYELLRKLNHSDKWYIEKVGKEWVIKKNLIELLLLVELNNFDVFENKLQRFKRQYSGYLKEINQDRVLTFLKYVDVYYNNPKEVATKEFLNKIENSFEWLGAKKEDIFVMSFYAWLKSKMIQKPIYQVTLSLISEASKLE